MMIVIVKKMKRDVRTQYKPLGTTDWWLRNREYKRTNKQTNKHDGGKVRAMKE